MAVLVNEEKPAGTYNVQFSVKGESSSKGNLSHLSSGIYFYRLVTNDYIETKKMTVLK